MNFDFREDIILENETVLLRPISEDDIVHLLPIAVGHPTLLQYSPKQVYTEELLNAYVRNALNEWKNETRYTFIIFNKRDNRYAGSTAFMNISTTDDRLEIGATWLDPVYHGSGLNRQCKYLLLQYAFEKAGAHRVEFRTDARNLQSQKAIEKIGGKLEGKFREHMMMQDGYRRTSFLYSILQW